MIPKHQLRKCWFLAGPTAVGKTAASLLLAERIGAEILSMDSMAIYRGMDIGTAKPSTEEQSVLPHHLIDLIDPHEEFSVVEYIAKAQEVVEDVLSRGRVPLFVGGTGLYLRSLLRGVFDGPEADPELRRQLEQQRLEHGNSWLKSQLRDVDPVTAERLHENDTRRIIRAIEVHRLTGQAISSFQNHKPLPKSDRPAVFWINPPRDWLHERVDSRVDAMMQQGLLQETEQLLSATPPPGKTAGQALGYRELIDHLRGKTSLGEAINQIKIGTRQFAKRQHTWFRGLEECQEIEIQGTESAETIVSKMTSTADEVHGS